jgi:hypothetical protein
LIPLDLKNGIFDVEVDPECKQAFDDVRMGSKYRGGYPPKKNLSKTRRPPPLDFQLLCSYESQKKMMDKKDPSYEEFLVNL